MEGHYDRFPIIILQDLHHLSIRFARLKLPSIFVFLNGMDCISNILLFSSFLSNYLFMDLNEMIIIKVFAQVSHERPCGCILDLNLAGR